MKHNRFTSKRTILIISAFIIVMATAIVIVTKHGAAKATPSAKPALATAVKSQFSFTGVSDWTQGATRMTDMALFHKYDCFTSIQHKTGAIVTDKEQRQKIRERLIADGNTVVAVATPTVTLQTKTGQLSYELQQFNMTPPAGGEKIKSGLESGYIQLSDSYLYIEGNCDTAEQLASTIPALQAIKFDETIKQ